MLLLDINNGNSLPSPGMHFATLVWKGTNLAFPFKENQLFVVHFTLSLSRSLNI